MEPPSGCKEGGASKRRKAAPKTGQRRHKWQESPDQNEAGLESGSEMTDVPIPLHLQQQLLKLQSFKCAATKSNISKFKDRVRGKESKSIMNLTRRKKKREETRESLRLSLSSIFQVQDIDALEPESDPVYNAFQSNHRALKSGSLDLLKAVAEFQSAIKDIKEKDMSIGEEWNRENEDAKNSIQELAGETKDNIELFLTSENGGWHKLMNGWSRSIQEFLRKLPHCALGHHGEERQAYRNCT
ncbi:hypothetical protein BDZ91DRAFT_721898 [Kalaharituber pfeilii]|nr:hypothetical protein BDZ91DRAFT_721898 [Kalaharituber pfeilii]